MNTALDLKSYNARERALQSTLPKFEKPVGTGELNLKLGGESKPFSYEVYDASDKGQLPSKSNPLKLILNGLKSGQEALFAGAEAVMDFASKTFGVDRRSLAVKGVAAVMAVGAATNSAEAARIDGWAVEPRHNELGDVPGTLWVTAEIPYNEGTYYFNYTAFPIGKETNLATGEVKTYLATVGHGDYGGATITGIGDGNNFITDRGRVFENIQLVYDGGIDLSGGGLGWDAANDIKIFSSSTSVPDSWIRPLAPENSSVNGTLVSVAGFSQLYIQGEGRQPVSGDNYGFKGEINNGDNGLLNFATHKAIRWRAGSSFEDDAMSEQGGSGSWVIDPDGKTLGMVVGYSPYGPTTPFGGTYFADFTTSGYREQVMPFSGITYVPEPTSVASVLLLGSGLLLRRTRKEE